MSKRGDKTPTGTYLIGYGRPPVANRFRPGHSGHTKHPKGEPRKETSAIARLFEERLTVIVSGKKHQMFSEDLMLRKQREKAAGGDLKATKYLLERRDQDLALRMKEPAQQHDMSVYTDEEIEIITNILEKVAARTKL